MSEESELIRQTLALCEEINEKCERDTSTFTYDILKSKIWYIEILQALCPYLGDDLELIKNEKNQSRAIDCILELINSLDEFNEDVTESIKGENVVAGDPVQIYYIVQVFLILLEEAIKDQQQSGEQQSEEKEIQIKIEGPQRNPFSNYIGLKNNATKSQEILKEQKQSHHSVIGIQHEFQEQDNSQRDSDFDIPNTGEQNHDLPQSNAFRPIQQIEAFTKDVKPNNFEQESSQSDKYQMSQKLSSTKMGKNTKKLYKNPQENKVIIKNKKKSHKKLVQHPKTSQKLKKAKSVEAIKITQEVKRNIKSPKTKQIHHNRINLKSPVSPTIKKKKKELEYCSNDYQTHKKAMKKRKNKHKSSQLKTTANFQKLLNWREQRLKRQQKEYEQSLNMKLQNQKELYVRKLNNVVIKMEKQKAADDKKEFKEKLIQQNNQAVRKLAALEKFYQDRVSILNEDRHKTRVKKNHISTGHKQIVGQIERQLKKQNDQKIFKVTEKFRKESELIQCDLENLDKKVMAIYTRN